MKIGLSFAVLLLDALAKVHGNDDHRRLQLGALSHAPSCCDPLLQPGRNGNKICESGSACCPDGTWACSIDNGTTFVCGGLDTVNPKGIICDEPCCGRYDKPACEKIMCCPDGTSRCPDKVSGLYPCGPVSVPEGTICDDLCCDPLLEPGKNGNPTCFEGHACCPDGIWTCNSGSGTDFLCNNQVTITLSTQGNVCKKPCCDPRQQLFCLIGSPGCCPDGKWTCPDGVTGLYPCDTLNPQGKFCPICCKTEATPDCGIAKASCCVDGTWTCPVNGVYECGGQTTDLFVNGKACDKCCPLEDKRDCGILGKPQCCSDGTWVCPDVANPSLYSCGGVQYKELQGKPCSRCCEQDAMPPCPTGGDAGCCPDGSWVCPSSADGPYICGSLKLTKPTGTVCPCCDPAKAPVATNGALPCRGEGYACCPDGSWVCSIGDGKTFPCGGELVVNPTGKVCDKKVCCEPSQQPFCVIGTASCCPDGTWSCPNGANGPYLCGDLQVDKPSGTVCACCNPNTEPGTNSNPLCIEGHACCPDGTWSCSIGDGQTFSCGGVSIVNPNGKVCPKKGCCEPDLMPPCPTGGAAGCCPDGGWVCPNTVNGRYQCGDVQVTNPTGTICACCDPDKAPGSNGVSICKEGYACCPDGSWACSIGDGKTFPCGGELVVNPTGKVCDKKVCCEPSQQPFCLIGTASCCPDGTWSCPNGANGPYLCGDLQVETPSGTVCGCCDPSKAPTFCWEGIACCPGGSWSCSIGDGMTYPCDGILVVNPNGKVCDCCKPGEEPGKFGNPLCKEGHACCPDGTWSCSIGDGKTFPCGGINVVNPNGVICPSVINHTGGNPWTYIEPVWWKDLLNSFKGRNLKKCYKRKVAPKNGSPCGINEKTCFFGTQICDGTGYQPGLKCQCNGQDGKRGTWVCTPSPCPLPLK